MTHLPRRAFLGRWLAALAALAAGARAGAGRPESPMSDDAAAAPGERPVTLFLCGDVMTGRAIDQIMPQPVDPVLYEPYVDSALDYLALAEAASGAIPRPVEPAAVWGDALAVLKRRAPDACIVNLETAITTHPVPAPKGINYRMHPAHVAVLTAAGVDCAVLANNHVMDWGVPGLVETLETLERAGVASAGAGRDEAAARAPAVISTPAGGRVLVFAFGHPSSGVPADWGAGAGRPGVALLKDLSPATARALGTTLRKVRRPGDLVVVSLHWGGNWGWEVPPEQRDFAHALIDAGAVDVVHGHSSHHVKGIEVYGERLVLYGCGDFINDYEGISGHEGYRAGLGLMYFPRLAATSGRLLGLDMVPTRLERLRVNRARLAEARWLAGVLDREGRRLGTTVTRREDGVLELRWD